MSIFLVLIPSSIYPATVSRFLSFFSFFPKTSRCSFFQSKSGSGEAPRRRHLGFSRDVCLDREAEKPTLEVCLIRCSAGCPTSIRNPFVGSDLFFRRILSKGHLTAAALIVSSESFLCQPEKNACRFSRTMLHL